MSHSQPTTDQQAARKTTRRGEIVYDTQSILGRKRGLVAASAHTFENVKLTKQWELDHVIPLSLALPPRRPIPPSNIREDRAVLRHRRRLLPRLSELPGSLERLPESSSAPKAPPNSSTHSAPTSTPNPGTDTIVTEPPLLHPELVLLVQQLYYDERQEALTPPQATQLWYAINDAQRSYILEVYDHALAKAQLRAAQMQTDDMQVLPQEPASPQAVPSLAPPSQHVAGWPERTAPASTPHPVAMPPPAHNVAEWQAPNTSFRVREAVAGPTAPPLQHVADRPAHAAPATRPQLMAALMPPPAQNVAGWEAPNTPTHAAPATRPHPMAALMPLPAQNVAGWQASNTPTHAAPATRPQPMAASMPPPAQNVAGWQVPNTSVRESEPVTGTAPPAQRVAGWPAHTASASTPQPMAASVPPPAQNVAGWQAPNTSVHGRGNVTRPMAPPAQHGATHAGSSKSVAGSMAPSVVRAAPRQGPNAPTPSTSAPPLTEQASTSATPRPEQASSNFAGSVPKHWSLSSLSSDGDLGLQMFEDIAERDAPSVQPAESQKKNPPRNGVVSRTPTFRSQRPTHGPSATTRKDKGKQRADAPTVEDESMDCSGEDAHHDSSTPSRQPSYENNPGDQAGQINAEVVLLLLQQMSGVQASFREQAEVIKESLETNKQLQELLAQHLKRFEHNVTDEDVSPSTPVRKGKTTSTRVADMKVQRRVAQSMGVTMPLTAEEKERRIQNRFTERVHKHLYALLRLKDMSTLAKRYPPLTDEEIESYKNGEGNVVCTPEKFRIDFEHPWKKFAFNMEARAIVIETFRAKVRSGAFDAEPIPERLLTKEAIGDAVDQYIATLRRTYRKQVEPPTKDATDKAQRTAAMTTRQGTLYRSRQFIINRVRGLARHSLLFDRLSANNMSGDETDGDSVKHSPLYRIVLAEWQSLELRAFLWAIDAKYIGYWASPPGSRRSKGNPPRKRILRDSSRTVPGVAPTGLWRNCYNEAWLAKKQDWEVEALEITPEDYDFTVV